MVAASSIDTREPQIHPAWLPHPIRWSAHSIELIEHCRGLIAHYKCPKSVIIVDELPVLPTGKINKVLLRQQYANPA